LKNKSAKQVLPRDEREGGNEVAQTMYAHVSKYKNNKIKKSWCAMHRRVTTDNDNALSKRKQGFENFHLKEMMLRDIQT
jgi:hypothetical protein